MDTAGATKETTIKEQTEALREMLNVLIQNIDNLVERNPTPETKESGIQDRPGNVFDEILSTVNRCKDLTREATEKVQDGISRKVH